MTCETAKCGCRVDSTVETFSCSAKGCGKEDLCIGCIWQCFKCNQDFCEQDIVDIGSNDLGSVYCCQECLMKSVSCPVEICGGPISKYPEIHRRYDYREVDAALIVRERLQYEAACGPKGIAAHAKKLIHRQEKCNANKR